jgi:carbamoyl-phosphate synthase large subunit
MAVYPPVSLSVEVQREMVLSACRIARALGVHGLMNIQFVVAPDKEGRLRPYVLEVNPRASRTVPYLSKVTGIPMVDLATRCMMGETLSSLGYEGGLWVLDPKTSLEAAKAGPCPPHAGGRILPEADIQAGMPSLPKPILYAVKAPVFSFQKLARVEPSLGPEMKSTGEILGIDYRYEAALYKALVASGIQFKGGGDVVLTVNDADKAKAVDIARELTAAGIGIIATSGTARLLREAGIECREAAKIQEGSPNLLDLISSGQVSLMINTPAVGKRASDEGARIRRACIESGVACVTNIDTAGALARAIQLYADPANTECRRLEEYLVGSEA